MAKLSYNDLPECVKKDYVSKNIHKIVKPSQTLLTIHTKSREKHNWKKTGNNWLRLNQAKDQDVCDIEQTDSAIL